MKVLVLGAGVVGVTSAWYLAQAGHEVTVLDRQPQAAQETSFANGGQISAAHAEPWAKPSLLPKLARWLGREDAPLLFRARADWAQWEWALRFLGECMPGAFERNCRALAGLAAYSRECLLALRDRLGISYDHLSRGILHFATDARDFEVLARGAEAVRTLGIAREVKSAPECLALEPALRDSHDPVAGGVYTPSDESGDAHRFTRELARLASQCGVAFRFNAALKALEAEGGSVTAARLEDDQRLSADAYVVALGSYSPLLLRPLGIRIPVYPLKGYSITLPLGPAEEAAAPSVSLTDEAHKIVISRLGSRLRAAGTAELAGYDTGVNTLRCAAITRRVRELFPGLGAITTLDTWAGLRPATPNNVPLIGRTRLSNLFLNTGYGTLGWTLACGSGRALADLVSGRAPDVPFRFEH
ncbi:MAG TPA: D-amino acid dehydrogenase [Burkholderiales bacterium]|nr:D-amino acid dehydrogenase [Burkholderiales bacterium]